MTFGCPSSPPKRIVFRFHETILSFGEPGSLGEDSSYNIWAACFFFFMTYFETQTPPFTVGHDYPTNKRFLQCVTRLDQAIRMVPIDNLAPPLPMQDGSCEYQMLCNKLGVLEVDKCCFPGDLWTMPKSGSTVSGTNNWLFGFNNISISIGDV